MKLGYSMIIKAFLDCYRVRKYQGGIRVKSFIELIQKDRIEFPQWLGAVLCILLAFFLMMSGQSVVEAQDEPSNTVNFTVTDRNTGEPVEGVQYHISPMDEWGENLLVTSGPDGKISQTLPIGKYSIFPVTPNWPDPYPYFYYPSRMEFQVTETNQDNLSFDIQVSSQVETLIKGVIV